MARVPFAAWLLWVAANTVADRSIKTTRERHFYNLNDPPEAQKPDLEEVEQRARLFGLVGTLPPDQRRVIVIRFAEEKGIRDIAQELGAPKEP